MTLLSSRLMGVSLLGILGLMLLGCSDTTFTEDTSRPDPEQDSLLTGVKGQGADFDGAVQIEGDDDDHNPYQNRSNDAESDVDGGDREDLLSRSEDGGQGGDSQTADSDGNGLGGNAGNETNDLDSEGGGFTRSETRFSLEVSEAPLDMIWVIDNSGSMKNEIATVKANLDRFITAIADRVNLRLMLVSEAGDDDQEINLSNPAKNDGHIQINAEIHSHDSLVAAALVSCPAEQNSKSDDRICNQPVAGFAGADFNDLSGKLVNQFRPDAQRVYVVVTDDRPKSVTDSGFLQMVQPLSGEKPMGFFGFVGFQDRGDCEIDGSGDAYARLAAASGGKVFDICEPDWTEHFDQLAENVVVIANSEFELGGDEIEIVSVRQGGEELPASAYRLVDSKIVVAPEALDAEGGDVVVEYDHKSY